MRISRVFVEQPLAIGDTAEMLDATAHYLRNVLRLKEGSAVVLFNGTGGEYRGEVSAVERNRVRVHISSHDETDRESPLALSLGIAVIKRDAMDNALQKATELGVHVLTPILTDHTATSRKALDKRYSHWKQIIRSACEQCGRNRPPQVNPVTDLASWIEHARSDLKLIAHPDASSDLNEIEASPGSIDLLIGPEGGFDDDEVARAVAAGFRSVSLGPRILRADTAPIALISLVQARWGDLR